MQISAQQTLTVVSQLYMDFTQTSVVALTPEIVTSIISAVEATLVASGVVVTSVTLENGVLKITTSLSGSSDSTLKSGLDSLLSTSSSEIVATLINLQPTLSEVKIDFLSVSQ
jgi:hypothetical protein